jgi:hypothetical protein
MKTKATDEQKFLDWCKEHKVKPVKKVRKHEEGNGFSISYYVTAYVKVLFAGIEMVRPREEWTVYFNSDSSWMGGSNLLWDEKKCPWIN